MAPILPPYYGTRIDPITGRPLSWCCWNGRHENDKGNDLFECLRAHCQCGCHPPRDEQALAAEVSDAAA